MSLPLTLQQYLRSHNLLDEDNLQEMSSLFSRKKVNKGDFFIQSGELADKVAFIEEGIFRSYIITDKGDDFTYCINFPGRLMAAYGSFISGEPTREFMQAITPAQLWICDAQHVKQRIATDAKWMYFAKSMAEQQYIELEERVLNLHGTSAKKRYDDLQARYHEWLQHIPLQYLASYLNITPRHLSRIRAQK